MEDVVSLLEIRGEGGEYEPLKARFGDPSQIMGKFNTEPPSSQSLKVKLDSLYYYPELYILNFLTQGIRYNTRIIFFSEANFQQTEYKLKNGPYKNFHDDMSSFYFQRINEQIRKSNCGVAFECYYYNPGTPSHLKEERNMCRQFYGRSLQKLG